MISSSFSWLVIIGQTGALACLDWILLMLSRPNVSTMACRYSILAFLRATYCPTSSMTQANDESLNEGILPTL